jgi:hypothetical protein
VLTLLLVPLVPVAALLFLLGAERLEHGLNDSQAAEFARSRSALGEAVERARGDGQAVRRPG